MEISVIKHTEVGTITIGTGEEHWMDAFAQMAMADMREDMREDMTTRATYQAGELTLNVIHDPESRPGLRPDKTRDTRKPRVR